MIATAPIRFWLAVVLSYSLVTGCTSYLDPTRASDERFVESLQIGQPFSFFVQRKDRYAVDQESVFARWRLSRLELVSACGVANACNPEDLPDLISVESGMVANRVVLYSGFVGSWRTRDTILIFDREDRLLGWAKVGW